MIISLTGFMGCGKSSVGRELSKLLCCPFMDLDTVIEETSGRSIPEIFATDGESAFRQMERDALKDIAAPEARGWKQSHRPDSTQESIRPRECDAVVLALGGGTVMTRECEEMVHGKTFCVYLRASVETLVRNLDGESESRPMLAGNLMDRINELMDLRSETYERTAHVIIDTDGKSVEEIAVEICRTLEKNVFDCLSIS